MDKARQKTDKRLKAIESEIGRVYASDPALLAVKKQYMQYMVVVQKRTKPLFEDYINESDQQVKAEKKKAYTAEVRSLTVESKQYNALIKKFTQVMAAVNQKAIDIANRSVREVYAVNYNEVAEQCKNAGIKVDG